MGNLFSGWHLLLILAVILLLFGAAKLPALAKSVGQSARAFKGEMKAMKDDDTATQADDATVSGGAVSTGSGSVTSAGAAPATGGSMPSGSAGGDVKP